MANLRCTQSFIAIQITYFTAAAVTKISLILLYHRIFGVVKIYRYALMVAAFLVIGYWIAATTTSIAGCNPVSLNWKKGTKGHCINEIAFFRWNGICNLLLDCLILCLPMPMVWRLHVDIKHKLVLTAIFCLGGLSVYPRRIRLEMTLIRLQCLHGRYYSSCRVQYRQRR